MIETALMETTMEVMKNVSRLTNSVILSVISCASGAWKILVTYMNSIRVKKLLGRKIFSFS